MLLGNKIGDRIKSRREELEMSQEELAVKIGYKTRSSINKIEKDASGLPQKKIYDIAKALQTTPGFIMGWEEPTPQQQELTEAEAQLLAIFRQIPEADQEKVLFAVELALRSKELL